MQLNNCVPKFPGLAWRRLQNAGPPEPGGSGFPPSDFDQKYCSIKTLHYCVHLQIFIPSTGTEMHCTVKLKEILKNSIWWYVTEFQAKTYLNIAKPGDLTSTIIIFLNYLYHSIAELLTSNPLDLKQKKIIGNNQYFFLAMFKISQATAVLVVTGKNVGFSREFFSPLKSSGLDVSNSACVDKGRFHLYLSELAFSNQF